MTRKLAAILLCDSAVMSPDGKFTLYGIFDAINCRELPAKHPQFSIFWKMYSDQLGKVSIQIEKPDGTCLYTSPAFDLAKSPSGNHQGVVTLGGVEFTVAGDYKVLMVFDDTEEIGSGTLRIQKTETIQ